MDAEKIKSEVIAVLVEVAPEVDADTLDPARNFRDQFEFDSIDFLDLVLKFEKCLGYPHPTVRLPKAVVTERGSSVSDVNRCGPIDMTTAVSAVYTEFQLYGLLASLTVTEVSVTLALVSR